MTDEILYSPSITYLNLHILDQNDNHPIFTNPPYSAYRIGFPDEELIKLIMPLYLYKVAAYDLDDGINAIIRYSISMPGTFEIDPLGGEIYPLGPLPNDESQLLITAIDRDGAGLRTSSSLRFVKLTAKDIIEIIVDNFSNQDAEELAVELSEKMQIDFRILKSTQLPFRSSSKAKEYVETSARSKVFAYALQNNSLELIHPEQLIEKLDSLDINLTIHYSIFEGCSDEIESSEIEDCDYLIWIVIVSFMGTFIFVMLLAIPLVWFHFVKKKLKGNDTSSESSKEEIAEHFYEADSRRQSSPIPVEVAQLSRELRPADAEITEVDIDRHMTRGSVSSTEKLNNRLLTLLDDDDSPSQHDRKVKFNELVERIEVIEDSDTETIKD